MSNPDDLAYFRGWKDACDDVANFLDHLADTAPDNVKIIAQVYKEVASSVRSKGETALSMAESMQELLN